VTEIEGGGLDFEFAGAGFGVIENVVEDNE